MLGPILSFLDLVHDHPRTTLSVIGALLLALAVWWVFEAGRAYEHAAQDKASLTNLRDRSAIDDAVQTDDDVALCMRLGGSGDCRGLRNGR